MIRVYLALVDLVPSAVVLIPLFLILNYTVFRRDLRKSFLYMLFCLYLCCVFILVGIPNVLYFRPDINWNLIPFRGMIADLKNSILNIVLFVPLGFVLTVLWQRFRKLQSTIFFGFSFSLTIELLQMLTYRATDVNDLITNTLGAIFGFLLAKTLTKRHSPIGKGNRDVYVLWAMSFCVVFFLHPFLSPLIWDILL